MKVLIAETKSGDEEITFRAETDAEAKALKEVMTSVMTELGPLSGEAPLRMAEELERRGIELVLEAAS